MKNELINKSIKMLIEYLYNNKNMIDILYKHDPEIVIEKSDKYEIHDDCHVNINIYGNYTVKEVGEKTCYDGPETYRRVIRKYIVKSPALIYYRKIGDFCRTVCSHAELIILLPKQ